MPDRPLSGRLADVWMDGELPRREDTPLVLRDVRLLLEHDDGGLWMLEREQPAGGQAEDAASYDAHLH